MMDNFSGWNTPSDTGNSYENVVSGADIINNMRDTINLLLVIILIIGLILGMYLIYRKHKGEKKLWKKFLKWDLLFFFIIAILWIIVSIRLWQITSIGGETIAY